jgi:phosphate/sulfate permease
MSRVVSTRALTPRAALIIAALISTKVERTVGGGIIEPQSGRGGLVVVLAALLGAIA